MANNSSKAKLQSFKTEVANSLNVNLSRVTTVTSPRVKPVLSAARW